MQLPSHLVTNILELLVQKDLTKLMGTNSVCYDVCVDLIKCAEQNLEKSPVQLLSSEDAEEKKFNKDLFSHLMEPSLIDSAKVPGFNEIPFGEVCAKADEQVNLSECRLLNLFDKAVETPRDISRIRALSIRIMNGTAKGADLEGYYGQCEKLHTGMFSVNCTDPMPLAYFRNMHFLGIANTGQKNAGFCRGFEALGGLTRIKLLNIVLDNDQLALLASVPVVEIYNCDSITDVSCLSGCREVTLVTCPKVTDITCLRSLYRLYVLNCEKVCYQDGAMDRITLFHMSSCGTLPEITRLGYEVKKPTGEKYKKRYFMSTF